MNSTGYIGLNNTPSASSHKKTHKHIARVSLTAVRQIDDVVGDDGEWNAWIDRYLHFL